ISCSAMGSIEMKGGRYESLRPGVHVQRRPRTRSDYAALRIEAVAIIARCRTLLRLPSGRQRLTYLAAEARQQRQGRSGLFPKKMLTTKGTALLWLHRRQNAANHRRTIEETGKHLP